MNGDLDGIDFFDFTRINQQRQIKRGVQDTLSELVNKQWSQHGLPDRELPGRLPELEARYQRAHNNLEPLRDRKNDGDILRDTPKGQIFHDEIAQGLGPTSLIGAYLQLGQEEQHYFIQQRHKDKNDPLKGEKPWTQRFKDNNKVIDFNTFIYTTKQLHHLLTHDHQNKNLSKNHFSTGLDLHKYKKRLTKFKTLPNHSIDDAIHLLQQTHPEATQKYEYQVNLNEALQAYNKHRPTTKEGPTPPRGFLHDYNLKSGEKTESHNEGNKFVSRYKGTEKEDFIAWLKHQREQGNILQETWQHLTQTKGWERATTPDDELPSYEEQQLSEDLQHYIHNTPSDKSLTGYFRWDDRTKNFTGKADSNSTEAFYHWLREKREQGSIPSKTWNKLLQPQFHEGYKEQFYQIENRPAITPWPVTLDDAPTHSRVDQIRHEEQLQTLKHLTNGNTDKDGLNLPTQITYNNAANHQTPIEGTIRTKGEIFHEEIAPKLGPTTLLLDYLDLTADQQTYLLKERQTQINNDKGDPLQGQTYGGIRYTTNEQVNNLSKQIIHTKRLEQQLQQRTPDERRQLNLRYNAGETPFPAHNSLSRTIETKNVEGFVKNIERRNPEAVDGYEYRPLLKRPEKENPNFTRLYDAVREAQTL